MSTAFRRCPLCGGRSSSSAFPYAIHFSDQVFTYLRCTDCRTVFVDPVPDAACFRQMYAKSTYHDSHYSSKALGSYLQAARLLRVFAKPGSTVLDYGCGLGHFLQAIKTEGYEAIGVEFDKSAATVAANATGCTVFSIEEHSTELAGKAFDVVHLGDVLEHLPDPADTLAGLLGRLKPGGLLFVEGPLETNPSPIYWAARSFGKIKKLMRPGLIGTGVPTHLFRTSARAQSRFFQHRFPDLQLLYWQISETGRPYSNGVWLKRRIADAALALGGKTVAGFVFGNRFQAIYRLLE